MIIRDDALPNLSAYEPSQAGAYPGFCRMKREMPVQCSVTPSIKVACNEFIHSVVERGTVRVVSCPRTQGSVPGHCSNPDRSIKSAVTMRRPRLHLF